MTPGQTRGHVAKKSFPLSLFRKSFQISSLVTVQTRIGQVQRSNPEAPRRIPGSKRKYQLGVRVRTRRYRSYKTAGNTNDIDEPDHSGERIVIDCGFHEWLVSRQGLI